jgi:hypothetical protein
MKKIYRTWLLLAPMMLTIKSITCAQSTNAEIKINMEFSSEDSTYLFVKIADPRSFRLNELNPRAVRHFISVYKNVPDVKWLKSVDGLFVARFTDKNIQTCVMYNEKGHYEYTLRNYKEDKLPTEVRHLVKSNYYDFSIFYISEVEKNNKSTTYTIGLEDRRSKDNILYKIIRVRDGKMEVLKEHLKRWKWKNEYLFIG